MVYIITKGLTLFDHTSGILAPEWTISRA